MSRRSSDLRLLPVTTTSEQARHQFMAGRHHAFHYQARQAQIHLDAALALDPHFVLAYLHRGGMSSVADRAPFFEQARAHRERVSEDEGRMVDAFHAFLGEGRVEDAVAIFAELADRYHDDPYLPTYLGLRYLHNLHQLDAAEEQFQRARHRDPTFSQANLWLGHVALRQGEHDRAEQEFETYAEMAPDQPRPYDCLGLLSLRRGHLDEAEDRFRQALERDPGFIQSQEHLARAQIERSNRTLEDALRRHDLDAISRLYTTDARVTTPRGGLRSGPADVASAWATTLDHSTTVELETEDLYLGAEGDVATQVAGYRIVPASGIGDAGTAITVWALTAEGWKIHRSAWASEAMPGRPR